MTKHTCNDGAGPYFGRKTPGCPRCDELLKGAEPRRWHVSEAYQLRIGKGPAYEAFKARLKAHDCAKANCGPVCTAFDW